MESSIRRLIDRSSSPRRLRVVAMLMLLLGVLTVAIPVLAYTGSNYGWHDGATCGWDGTHEQYDVGPPHSSSTVLGATGIQYGYPSQCNMSRVKIRWDPTWGGAFTDIYESGLSGVNSGYLYGAEALSWTDHDVKIGGIWYGFRLNH